MTRPVEPGADGPILNRECEPWRGSFPGLGTVLVSADGAVEVVTDGAADTTDAERALRLGWGDLLSFARRGYALALAAAVVDPQTEPLEGALLISGEPRDIAEVALAMADRGWALMSDRPTPTRLEQGRLVAHPRLAPLLVADRLAARYRRAGQPVRADSNAVEADVPRWNSPAVVAGVVHVERRRPDEEALTSLSGQRRFERAALLMTGGALAPQIGSIEAIAPERLLEADLQVATLPWANLRIRTPVDPEDLEVLSDWWMTVRSGSDRSARS